MISLSLDHTFCVIFKASLSTSIASRAYQTAVFWTQAEISLNCRISRGNQYISFYNTHTFPSSISRGRLHISFHNIHKFPFIHVTASAYFHRCVLCREPLIDSSVKGQYATLLHTFFTKCQTEDIFLTPPPFISTPILQRMFNEKNSKNATLITHLKRRPFNHATITPFWFLSWLFIHSFLARLAILHAKTKNTPGPQKTCSQIQRPKSFQ